VGAARQWLAGPVRSAAERAASGPAASGPGASGPAPSGPALSAGPAGLVVITRTIGAADPDIARQVAEEILSDPRFHPARGPRPFAGFFHRVGELLVDPVIRFFRQIGDVLPDVGSPAWLTMALAVVVAAAVLTVRLSARRGRSASVTGRAVTGEDSLDPGRLERLADEAERGGDLDAALRLRFRAGLVRLDEAGVVRLRPGLTNSAVGRALRSPRFDELAGNFDEVAYGGRPATQADVATARTAWPAVLEAARPPARADR
jgi:hypothetical protein